MLYCLAAISLFVVPVNGLLFGGGCCAPAVSTGCCTSWAYAPPRVIGYERIPIYAKVPIPPPPPPPQYVRPPPTLPPYVPPPPPPNPPSYPEPYRNTLTPLPTDEQLAIGPQYGGTRVGPQFATGPGQFGGNSDYMSGPPYGRNEAQVITIPDMNDGDTIIIETDDNGRVRKRVVRKSVVQPPVGYVQSPPVGYVQQQPVGYQVQPQPQLIQQQPQPIPGPYENGVEVTLDQASPVGYNGQQNVIPTNNLVGQQAQGFVQSVGQSQAFENSIIAPSARKLRRKFKN